MASDAGRIVSFSLETVEKKAEVTEYAKDHGFRNASDLARFALYQYMKRYKGTRAKTCTAEQADGQENEAPGGENE